MKKRTHCTIFLFWILASIGNLHALAQTPKDGEIRKIPVEARNRIQLYFDLRKKEDWANLFEIDDWEPRVKDDYIAILSKEKANPYRRFRKLIDVYLEDTMLYFQSSKKWKIAGCSKIIDRENRERLVEGSIFLTEDSDRGWIIGNSAISWHGDGFHECKVPINKLPIQIKALD